MKRVSTSKRLKFLGSWLLITMGLLAGAASFSLDTRVTVIAQQCGNPYICNCYTDNVFCAPGCDVDHCIWETGVCRSPIGGMYPFCGFSYCDPICGVGGL